MSARSLLLLLSAAAARLAHLTLSGPALEGMRGETLEAALLALPRLQHLRLEGLVLTPQRT